MKDALQLIRKSSPCCRRNMFPLCLSVYIQYHITVKVSLSRTEEPVKAGTCVRDRRALQLALNVHIKHSDLT